MDPDIKSTILIVDDETSNVEFIVNCLEDDYTLKIAYDGEEALAILKKFDIDLVLLDIQMPKLDGYEVAKEIMGDEKLKEIPFIFLTAKNDSESLVYGLELGAKDYILKPFNAKELQLRVRNHLLTFQLKNRLEKEKRRLELAYSNLEKLIEAQDNMVILTDGKEMKFANKKFFEYFGYKDIDHFKQYHDCVCDYFIENDRFFHLGKVPEGRTWIEELKTLLHSQRIVSMMGKDFVPHAFSISINEFDENQLIISFADISQTMLNHIHLEEKVIHDKLTGAFNREYFEQNYKKLLDEYHTISSHFALAILDIDHFKNVNDTCGHDVGDEVLIDFVKRIKKYSRKDDILIRWGGEEFILVLKINSQDDLKKALEHVRKVIEVKDFPVAGQMTCSIGGAVYNDNEDIEKTIKRADEAVYEAKETGRNKVVIK